MLLRRHIPLMLATLLLASCGSGSSPATFETDAGEAAMRHVISHLPDLNLGVPKNYSIVLGEITKDGIMTPASQAFVDRFADLKLKFVNAMDLKITEPGPIIVDKVDRLATFILQLRHLEQTSPTTWQAETGWSYKQEFQRHTLKLGLKEGKITVVE